MDLAIEIRPRGIRRRVHGRILQQKKPWVTAADLFDAADYRGGWHTVIQGDG